MVQELDDELNPFPWVEGEQECIEAQGDYLESIPVMYHRLPPAPLIPVDTSPTIPSIGTLATTIGRSSNRLFFISYLAIDPSFPEWRLAHVSLEHSMEQHPACLQDGRFLVEFYIPHYSDV